MTYQYLIPHIRLLLQMPLDCHKLFVFSDIKVSYWCSHLIFIFRIKDRFELEVAAVQGHAYQEISELQTWEKTGFNADNSTTVDGAAWITTHQDSSGTKHGWASTCVDAVPS